MAKKIKGIRLKAWLQGSVPRTFMLQEENLLTNVVLHLHTCPIHKKKSKLNVKKQNKKKYLSLFNNLIQLFLFVLCFLTLKFFWGIYFWWECVQVKTSAPRSTSSDPLTPEIQALERWLTLSAEDRAWVSCKNSVCCNFWAGTHSNPKTCEFENFNLFSYSMKKC